MAIPAFCPPLTVLPKRDDMKYLDKESLFNTVDQVSEASRILPKLQLNIISDATLKISVASIG